MSYCPDLGSCSYFEDCGPAIRAVGWLQVGHPYAKGVMSPEDIVAIERLLIQRAKDQEHFEIVATKKMTQEEYEKKLKEVKTEKVEPLKKHEH